MRVLITGSSGQIGTNLGLKLLEEGREVVGLDLRPNPWTDQIPTRTLDLREPAEELDRALGAESWDVIVHLAAYAKVHELVVHPERALENVVMTFSVLELAKHIGEALGSEPEIRIEQTRPGEISRYVADIGKARRLLGYAPTTLPHEGVRKAIAWAREHAKQKAVTR